MTVCQPLVVFTATILLSVFCTAPASAQSLDRDKLESLKASVVLVKVTDPELSATGSGFLLGKTNGVGYFVTNSHVVSDGTRVAKTIEVVLDSSTATERLLRAEVAGNDPVLDLAVLKVRADSLPEIIASDTSPDVYETLDVLILGFPFGAALASRGDHPAITVSKGSVSSIRRDSFDEVMAIQFDGSINPGSSGGPIVTTDGQLVGIAVAKLENTQIGFAIPSLILRRMLLGRATSVSFVRSDPKHIEAKVTVVDPLERVDRCAIIVGPTIRESDAVQSNDDGAWLRLPDSKTFELQQVGKEYHGELEIDASSEGQAMYQVALLGKNKQVTYNQPSALNLKQPAPNAVAQQELPPEKDGGWLGKPNEDGAPNVEATSEEVKLAKVSSQVQDLRVTPLDVDAKTLLPHIVWSEKGDYVYLLHNQGLLRKVRVPSFVEVGQLDLQSNCSFLGMSTAGLLVVENSTQNLVTIDPDQLAIGKSIRVPGINRVACAPKSSFVFAASGSSFVAIDLRKGRVVASTEARMMRGDPRLVKRTTEFVPATGLEWLTMSPDGKYLFAKGGIEMLQRMRVSGTNLTVEEFSPRIGQNTQNIVISSDSKYVAMPSGGGNYPADGHPDLNYGTYIYSVGNLQSPALGISTGAYPRALAFDVTSGKIYAQNSEHQLIVLNPGGVIQSKYKLSDGRDDTRYLAVHPLGDRLLVLTSNELMWVDLSASYERSPN